MKEAFWGVLIVTLGLFGIVIVNLFQNITVDNDRIYYVIKEATEGAAFDAIDLANYRLTGTIRIVEDKFVENLTRRFAENISKGNYKIIVEDINEMPPKVSLRVQTGVGMLNTGLFSGEDPFNIVNRVDAIIETKYTKEEIESSGIIITDPEDPIIGDVCKPTTGDIDDPCIDGDIMFTGDEEISISNKICSGMTPPNNINKKVNYKVCECGTWVEKSETLTASPRKVGNEWVYEFAFYKEGKNRVINQVIKEKVLELQCTEGIEIYVPDDIDEKNQNNVTIPYQPSSDNSKYEICPPEGIKIPLGMEFVAHPNYIPEDSINRDLKWITSDSSILGVTGTNPSKSCDSNTKPCFSTGTIIAKKLGTTQIKVETTQIPGIENPIQTATCKVQVYDGKVDSVGCKNINLEVGETSVVEVTYKPLNATKKNYTYSIADTAIATISGNNITAKAGGTTTITVKETNSGKTGTCTITVPIPPEPPATYPESEFSPSGSTQSSGGYYKVTSPDGKEYIYNNLKDAQEAATTMASSNPDNPTVLSYKNPGNGNEIKYSEYTGTSDTAAHDKIVTVTTYNGSSSAQKTVTTTTRPNGDKLVVTKDANGNVISTEVYPNSPPYVEPEPAPIKKPGSSNRPNVNITCLDGNTKILTKKGYKNIRDINVGDMVLSYNSETKENEYKEVTAFYKHINTKDVLYTMIVNNKTIKATRLHRFYVKTNEGYEYVKVEDLKIGDLLMDSDGYYHPIRKITSKFMLSNYYDIEVKDNHNYYVGRDNILVHNAIKNQQMTK